mmetsp:Transcript_19730/g.25736  ORF Transcript_19730/g.25736 Transcript_19730/m.25736 type:complete len:201 (+) Transcript_19730:356-958(+)
MIEKIQNDNKDMVVVGWFMVGRSVLTPSIRHASIHQALTSSLLTSKNNSHSNSSLNRPLCFLSVVSGISSHCTKNFQYQMFTNNNNNNNNSEDKDLKLQKPSLELRPSPIQVSNLTNDSYSEYNAFTSVGSLNFLPSLATEDQFPPLHILEMEKTFEITIESLKNRVKTIEKDEVENEELRIENEKLMLLLVQKDSESNQ